MILRRAAIVLQRLTARERRLLAALALAGLPLLAVFGVAQPLARARSEVETAAAADEALSAWVAARASEVTALRAAAASAATPGAAAIGISGVEQSLEAAGLRGSVSRMSNRSDGQLELGFEEVRFSALMAWLQAVEPGWGYRLAAFRIEAGEAGDIVAAEFALAQAGAP